MCDCSGVEPLLPIYSGACLTNVVPGLLSDEPLPEAWDSWFPTIARDATQVVLLVVDALGWEQLGERPEHAPTLSMMEGGAITSVCPTTTATALTSITTGRPPGEHGVVGYRIAVEGEILNSLRWTTAQGDARKRIEPSSFQPCEIFGGENPPVVGKGEFVTSGFTDAHLRGTRYVGYRGVSGIAVEVDAQLRTGAPLVFAYYDGLDRTAHEFGFGDHYGAELQLVDRLVDDILAVLPRGGVLLVTADHGQVDCTNTATPLARTITDRLARQTGEARFRWLHARDADDTDSIASMAREFYDDKAWIRTRDEMLAEGWFGPVVTPDALARLGDVAVMAKDNWCFEDPADNVPIELIGRHGSFTSAEVHVPLLAGWR